MTQARFADTMILAYAVGGESELRAPCRALIALVAAGELELHVSAEAIQELSFHRLRRSPRDEAIAQARDLADMCIIKPFDEHVARAMIDLVEATTVRGRDAVHAATALGAGFDEIITTDTAFDAVPGLRRMDPREIV